MKLFPEAPQPLLAYTVSPLYRRYCQQRDGWKGQLKIVYQAFLFSTFAWLAISYKNPDFPDLMLWVQDFILLGGCLCLFQLLTRRFSRPILFFDDYFGSGRKHPHRYQHYSSVKIERILFQGTALVGLTFLPKNKWLQTGYELGLEESADLDPLITFLESKGLLVTKSI